MRPIEVWYSPTLDALILFESQGMIDFIEYGDHGHFAKRLWRPYCYGYVYIGDL